MSNKLLPLFRNTQRSAAIQYATVEAIVNGLVTVILGDGNQRFTNLNMVGGTVQVGDTVILDYSSGTPPTVRPSYAIPVANNSLGSLGAVDLSKSTLPDSTFKIHSTNAQIINVGATETIAFQSKDFDAWSYFNSLYADYITLPQSGFYMIVGTVEVTPNVAGYPDLFTTYESAGRQAYCDNWDYNHGLLPGYDWGTYDAWLNLINEYYEISLVSDVSGLIGWNTKMPVYSSRDNLFTTCQVVAVIAGIAGEKISLHFKNTSSIKVQTYIDSFTPPTLFGYCLNKQDQDPVIAHAANTNTVNPPAPSTSLIDIFTNLGEMFFSNTSNAYVRAIAISQEQTNQGLTIDFKFDDNSTGGEFKIWLRSSYDWYNWNTPTTGYELSISNTGSWQIYSVINGSRTLLGSYTTQAYTAWQKIRFNVSGTGIKAKTWLAGESEPGWQVEISNAVITSGGMQLGWFRNSGEHRMYIDNLNLDTL